MPKQHLNDRFIKTATVDSRTEYYDQHLIDPETNTLKKAGVKGLALRVTAAGSKSFVYRYWYDGKAKRYKIGNYPMIKLSEARDKAKEIADMVNKGVDPLAEKKKRQQTPQPQTFQELVNVFKEKHIPTLSEKSQYEYKRIIDKELLPVFGKKSVKDITKQQVYNFLDDIAGKHKTMANRIRTVFGKIFSFGIDRGLIKVDKNIVLETPIRKEGETRRDRFYREDELKAIWEAFEYEDEPVQSLFKMLLLTGQRKTETSRMRWEDIRGNIWTIPAKDAKNNQPHDVPLSPLAVQVIEEMKPRTGESDFVFCSPKKKNDPIKWLKRAVERIQDISKVKDFRIHDMRRTVATYLAKDKVDRTVIGKILNHKTLAKDNSITAIYDRHSYGEEKRKALERWSQNLQRIISSKEAKVYNIR